MQGVVGREPIQSALPLVLRSRQVSTLAPLDASVSALAHDLKNPLTAIRTLVQLVRHKHQDDHFLERFERIVLQELERMDRLTDNLLEGDRAVQKHCETVDLAALLRQIEETYREVAQQQHVVLATAVRAPLPSLCADVDSLQRVFTNLTLNALEAMPQGGTLRITCQALDKTPMPGSAPDWLQTDTVAVVFQDTGMGIPPAQLQRVGRPFHTTKSTGSGLGLALTRSIVEAHGGRLHIASQVGHGTSVTVLLPPTPAPPSPPAQNA